MKGTRRHCLVQVGHNYCFYPELIQQPRSRTIATTFLLLVSAGVLYESTSTYPGFAESNLNVGVWVSYDNIFHKYLC